MSEPRQYYAVRPLGTSFKMGCDFSDKPIGMLNRKRRSFDGSFGFKPQQEFHSVRVGGIADRLEPPIRMRNLIDPPVSGVQEPVLFAEYLKLIDRPVRAIPSRVHPEGLKADVFLRDLVDKFQTR